MLVPEQNKVAYESRDFIKHKESTQMTISVYKFAYNELYQRDKML